MTADRRPAGLDLLPTAPLGSHAPPALYLLALEGLRAGGAGEADVREAVEDAAQLAILDQERAGLDVVSDGEVRRHDFILSFYARLTGLRETPPARRLGPYLYDSTPVWDVVEPVTAPDGLGAVAEFEFAPAGRVWAVPDCGLWETPRWLAVRKLTALTSGAEIVRKELRG